MSGHSIRPFLIGTLVFAGAGVSASATLAGECDELVAEALRAGEMPAVVVDPVTKSVEMRTSRGTCRESAGKWASRRLQSAAEPTASAPVPPPPPAPAKAPQAASAPIPEPPAKPPAPPAPRCDRLVDGLWRSTWVRLGGELFWLERVYTIDFDNDGRTDNVGFRLKSSAKGNEVTLHYLPRQGEVGANGIPELQIDDDRNVPRICFGVVDLNQPPPEPQGMGATVQIVPDLSAEVRGRVSGAAPAAAVSEPGRSEFPWGWLAGGIGVLIGIGGVAWGLMRGRKGKPEDELDEEEAEEEKTHRHAHEPAHKGGHPPERHPLPEEEEEISPASKKASKGLFGFLSGLGGGTKKRGAAKPKDDEPHDRKAAKGGSHPPGKGPVKPQRGAPPPRKAKPSN